VKYVANSSKRKKLKRKKLKNYNFSSQKLPKL
jgi:hypothetical protein